MRRLLPLALACLLAVQAVSASRALHARGARTNPKVAVPTSRKQYVQFVLSIQGKTCAELPQGPDKFNVAFRAAMKLDVATYIITFAQIGGFDGPAVAATIGTPGTNCTDTSFSGVNYANVRAAASFNGTNTTLIRDFLWDSTREGICSGKYRQDVWSNVAALMNTNSLTVRLNNGSRQNPFGANMGWVPIPQLPCPAPKPSPNPQVPSPSPAPAVPSPSPAPGCAATVPNSETQADGSCACTKPGFTINGTDNGKLVYCVSSSATICPAPVVTAVRDNSSPVPKLLSCITPATECPAPYTFPLYGQSPSVRLECRLPVVGCTYTSYTMEIRDANNVLIGCVNPSSNACPFVAFRSFNAKNTANDPSPFFMEFCKKVDACPVYSETPSNSTTYTVSGYSVSRTLQACLTINPATNECPANIPNADFPVEVVLGNPTSCGANGNALNNYAPQCKYDGLRMSRVTQCLATGAPCDPALFPLQIFRFVGAGSTNPTLVGCRQARPFPGECDFTANGMRGSDTSNSGADPNADRYDIEVFQTQNNLVGCVVGGARTCPADFPVARRDASGNIQSCAPATNAQNPCISNSAEPVPLMNADGTWMGVCVARTASCAVSYNSQYGTPVTIRNAIGDMIQCRKQIGTCPTTAVLDTDGVNSVFSTFPMFNSAGQIASCYPPAAVGSTCTISIDNSTYSVPVRSNGTLKGCLASTATKCPTDFPFTVISNGVVVSCAAAGDQTSCPSPSIPLTQGVGPVGAGSFVLVGCLNSTTTCPAAYPTTIALGINQPALECMVPGSVCYKGSQPFSLFEERTDSSNNKYIELTWCINPQQSITDCNQANPSTQFNSSLWSNAAEVYNNVGTSIGGCIRRPDNNVLTSLKSCPVEYPFLFKEASGATFQCRASIDPATTCAGAVAGATAPQFIWTYNVDVKDLSGNLIGCTQTGGTTCPTDGVIVSATANSASEVCLSGTITSCAGVTNPNGVDRSFPIYSGVKSGAAKLERCIAPFTATDCSGSPVNDGPPGAATYTVPVYANADATGQVVGCVRTTTEISTPCPASTPFFLLSAGPASNLNACIQPRPACNITDTAVQSWSLYGVEIYTANKTSLLGCMRSSIQCPVNPTSPYPAAGTTYFPVYDINNQLDNCQQQSANPGPDCSNFGPGLVPIINSNLTGATGPVVGCAPANQGNTTVGTRCSSPQFPVALYNRAGQLVSCRPATITCDPHGSNGYETAFIDLAANPTLQACWDRLPTRRRSLLASGNVVNSITNGCPLPYLSFWSSPATYDCLKGPAVTDLANCDSMGSFPAPYNNYTKELYYNLATGVGNTNATTSTLEGCMLNTVNACPTLVDASFLGNVTYAYKYADVSGALTACGEVFTTCPALSAPVYNTPNAGSTSPVVGCVIGTSCPSGGWGADFTFFWRNVSSSGSLLGCYLGGNNNNTCPDGTVSVATLTNLNNTQPPLNQSFDAVGCVSNGVCLGTELPLYDATSATDAAPVLRICVSNQAPNTTTCADMGQYTVPLLLGNLDTAVPPTALAQGCVRAGAAAGAHCPSNPSYAYPLINRVGGEITACFQSIGTGSCGTSAAGLGLVPLCSAAVQTATATMGTNKCPVNETRGCITNVPTNTTDSTLINAAIGACSSTRKYPTPTSYSLWVANLEAAGSATGALDWMLGCFSVSQCDTTPGAANVFGIDVTTSSSATPIGCVDNSQTVCQAFRTFAGQPSWQCSAT